MFDILSKMKSFKLKVSSDIGFDEALSQAIRFCSLEMPHPLWALLRKHSIADFDKWVENCVTVISHIEVITDISICFQNVWLNESCGIRVLYANNITGKPLDFSNDWPEADAYPCLYHEIYKLQQEADLEDLNIFLEFVKDVMTLAYALHCSREIAKIKQRIRIIDIFVGIPFETLHKLNAAVR